MASWKEEWDYSWALKKESRWMQKEAEWILNHNSHSKNIISDMGMWMAWLVLSKWKENVQTLKCQSLSGTWHIFNKYLSNESFIQSSVLGQLIWHDKKGESEKLETGKIQKKTAIIPAWDRIGWNSENGKKRWSRYITKNQWRLKTKKESTRLGNSPIAGGTKGLKWKITHFVLVIPTFRI